MFEPPKVPMATAAYTLFGVVLATWWHDDHHWPLFVVFGVSIALALGLTPIARGLVTTWPKTALRILEMYGWINGLLAAVSGCAVVLITVALSAAAGDADPQKELVGQMSAALTTLVGGLVVATKDSDDTLGSRVAKEFKAKFTMDGQPKPGEVVLKRDSKSLIAVFTNYENGWSDWSKDTRAARIDQLDKNLAQDRLPTEPARSGSSTRGNTLPGHQP